ncbi:homocysteine S-methyltransferase [Bacillus amyloliquefaciens]|uniref:homocysteine S-methyltransferase n=1 Tax=Bacillus amyloliquefaciens TaxID=1390 RepID=UPI0008256706|nr:homocysteine S-methyltransferase [Bacillus amyloliquefaciens]AOC89783.1 Homocysteine S-methyltransferase [Bacillus amyloliquefaciens]
MNPITQILDEYPVMIIDGAMATELERMGCDLNDDLWSAKILLERPELIKQVHAEYFAAGADCAITASYQSTIKGFAARGIPETEAIRLIQTSVELAAQARDEFWAHEKNRLHRPKPLIAASIGPYGASLADGSEYRGHYGLTEDELIRFHRPRMKALIESGADLLACETIPCLSEAKAITRLLEEFPGTYAWISFSAKDGRHISEGTPISECAALLDSCSQIAAIGINCTPIEHIPPLIEEIKRAASKPIIAYPNTGEQYDPVTKTWIGAVCENHFGKSAQSWYENGATLIGGCCRTKPADIRAIADWAKTLKTT